MSASHTTPAKKNKATGGAKKERLTILPGVGLVDLNDPAVAGKLAERLAGKVGDQLVLFAQYMQEGLLAASVAIGLDVMAEFMEADVTTVAGPRAATTPPVPPTAPATRRSLTKNRCSPETKHQDNRHHGDHD